MRTKTLALATVLVILAVATSATVAFAQYGTNNEYKDTTKDETQCQEDCWQETRQYTQQRCGNFTDEDGGWQEMRQHMEQRGETDEGCCDELQECTQERLRDCDNCEPEGDAYGGYGGCRK